MKKVKVNFNQIKIGLSVALVAVLIINLFLISGLSIKAENKAKEIKELTRPVNLEITVIKDKNCKDCFDLTPAIELIKNANTKIIKEEVKDIKEAKELIKKYGIKKIPTIILSGEINRTELNDFEEKDGELLFKSQKPVYIDAVSGNSIGRVSVKNLKDSSCAKCADTTALITGLEQAGVVIANKKTIERTSNEGKELIKKYKIEQIPTLILSSNISVYESISQAWSQIGTIEKDGSYIIRRINPPFINTSTGNVIGITDITLLTDKSCPECYDVTIHKSILNQYGVVLGNEKTIDITAEEAKKLIERYNIKAVPTIILSKDASNYPALVQIWSQVGSIEADGKFVFREITAMKDSVYRDLTTNKITK